MVWFYAGWHKETEGRDTPGRRSADRRKADAFAKGDGQVFSGRVAAVSASDRDGDNHGALRRRGRRILWNSAAGLSCRTWSRERGTRSSEFSGSRRRGSPRGLFIAPYICGYEPKYQKLGVDVLFGALADRRPRFDGRPMDERDAQAATAICGSGSGIRVMNTSISAGSGRRHLFVGLLLVAVPDRDDRRFRRSSKRRAADR